MPSVFFKAGSEDEIYPFWRGWYIMRNRLHKIKGHLFPSTFKVWESKVPLIFSIFHQELSFGKFWRCHGGEMVGQRRNLSTTIKWRIAMGNCSHPIEFWHFVFFYNSSPPIDTCPYFISLKCLAVMLHPLFMASVTTNIFIIFLFSIFTLGLYKTM